MPASLEWSSPLRADSQCASVRPSEWEWTPFGCESHGASSTLHSMCAAMTGGILVVGDSVSEQLALVLAAMLHSGANSAWKDGTSSDTCRQVQGPCHSVRVCNGSSTLGLVRADHLAGAPVWRSLAFVHSFQTVVVNTGAHAPQRAAERSLRVLRQLVRDVLLPNQTLVWWDTPLGHPDCEITLGRGPVASVGEAMTRLWARDQRSPLPYNWSSLISANSAVRDELDAHRSRALFLPFATMAVQRHDAHRGRVSRQRIKLRDAVPVDGAESVDTASASSANPGAVDCVHWCVPGPLEEAVRWLFRLLQCPRPGLRRN